MKHLIHSLARFLVLSPANVAYFLSVYLLVESSSRLEVVVSERRSPRKVSYPNC